MSTTGELKIKYSDEVTNAYSGQVNITISAYNPDTYDTYGYLDYSIFQGEVYIDMIKVFEQYRRRGVADGLYNKLLELEPGKKIKWGMLTEEGAALKKSLESKRYAEKRHAIKECLITAILKKGDQIVLKQDPELVDFINEQLEIAGSRQRITINDLGPDNVWAIDDVLADNIYNISSTFPIGDCEIGCACSNIYSEHILKIIDFGSGKMTPEKRITPGPQILTLESGLRVTGRDLFKGTTGVIGSIEPHRVQLLDNDGNHLTWIPKTVFKDNFYIISPEFGEKKLKAERYVSIKSAMGGIGMGKIDADGYMVWRAGVWIPETDRVKIDKRLREGIEEIIEDGGAMYKKVISGLDLPPAYKVEIDKDHNPYCVAYLSREDLREHFSQEDIDLLTEVELKYIAEKMGNAYLEHGYWVDLEVIAEEIIEKEREWADWWDKQVYGREEEEKMVQGLGFTKEEAETYTWLRWKDLNGDVRDRIMESVEPPGWETSEKGLRKMAHEIAKEIKPSGTYPMPGDFVKCIGSDDTLIPVGCLGVIEGIEGKKKGQYQVTFNPSPMPWWDKGTITSSGGPSRMIDAKDLKHIGTIKRTYQYFPGLPHAHSAKTIEKEVNLFSVDFNEIATERVEYAKPGIRHNVAAYIDGVWHWGTAFKRPDGDWDFRKDRSDEVHVVKPRHIKIYGKLGSEEEIKVGDRVKVIGGLMSYHDWAKGYIGTVKSIETRTGMPPEFYIEIDGKEVFTWNVEKVAASSEIRNPEDVVQMALQMAEHPEFGWSWVKEIVSAFGRESGYTKDVDWESLRDYIVMMNDIKREELYCALNDSLTEVEESY